MNYPGMNCLGMSCPGMNCPGMNFPGMNCPRADESTSMSWFPKLRSPANYGLNTFFFFKQKTAYEILSGLVGSEMCIRDRFFFFKNLT